MSLLPSGKIFSSPNNPLFATQEQFIALSNNVSAIDVTSGVGSGVTVTSLGSTYNVGLNLSNAGGISFLTYPGVTTVGLSNAGVTGLVAGSGIGVSGASGNVTVSNTGVNSVTAGAGITVGGTSTVPIITNAGLPIVTTASLVVTSPAAIDVLNASPANILTIPIPASAQTSLIFDVALNLTMEYQTASSLNQNFNIYLTNSSQGNIDPTKAVPYIAYTNGINNQVLNLKPITDLGVIEFTLQGSFLRFYNTSGGAVPNLYLCIAPQGGILSAGNLTNVSIYAVCECRPGVFVAP